LTEETGLLHTERYRVFFVNYYSNVQRGYMAMNLKIFVKKIYIKWQRFYLQKIDNRFFFEVQLADHCNLNCASCSHFSPIADEHFLDVDTYKKDCARFAELAGKYVRRIHLMGGEPLLHKNIVDIIEITRSNFKKSIIIIVTNGILLDRMGGNFGMPVKKITLSFL